MGRTFFLSIFILGTILLSGSFARAEDQRVTVGVLAKRGTELALERWSLTADYLTEQIQGYRFEIVPLDFASVRQAVAREEIDFIVTNTGYYIELESDFGVSRIATLKNLLAGQTSTVFGGVIFTRADRRDINNLEDLRGKSFMAVERQSFGGWLAGLRELHTAGLQPEHDFSELGFGGWHDGVVFAVREGRVDAGTVRTDTLERMAGEGKIDLDDFKILNRHAVNMPFPFLCSTRLYPEWPWAKLRHTSDDLAEKVTIALLGLSPRDPAAVAAKIAGWTVPLDYQPVHVLMKELHIGPYEALGRVTLQNVVRVYSTYLITGAVILLVMVLAMGWVINLNRRLEKTKYDLDQELENRTAAEEALNKAYDELELRVQRRTAQLSETNTLLLEENAERRRVEEELRRQKDFNENIVETALVLILTIDEDGAITQFNNHAEKVTGYSRTEVIGKNWFELSSPVEDQIPRRHLFDRIFTGREKQLFHESDIVCRNGSTRTISWQNSLLSDFRGRTLAILAIGVDVTERRLVEEQARLQHDQLIQADKMVALGTLVAGVAHEINNPTTSVMMNAPYVFKMWQGVAPMLEEVFEENGDFMVGNWPYSQVRERLPLLLHGITDGARRVKRIVAELKDYARHEGAAGAVPVDVNRAVEKALSLLSNLVKKSTRNFTLTLTGDLPKVLAQSQRLEQVIINLVINACQALPDDSRGVFVDTCLIPNINRVMIRVRDEGVGLPEKYISRVTDPFFTTKRESGGTGLGLAICSRIVKDCGGEILFESREGEGATVSVTLPPVDSDRGVIH